MSIEFSMKTITINLHSIKLLGRVKEAILCKHFNVRTEHMYLLTPLLYLISPFKHPKEPVGRRGKSC